MLRFLKSAFLILGEIIIGTVYAFVIIVGSVLVFLFALGLLINLIR